MFVPRKSAVDAARCWTTPKPEATSPATQAPRRSFRPPAATAAGPTSVNPPKHAIRVPNRIEVPQACRKLGVTDQTYYRWRKEYGGVRTDQVKRLKELEKQNVRLKKVVADLTLDNAILKEAAYTNF